MFKKIFVTAALAALALAQPGVNDSLPRNWLEASRKLRQVLCSSSNRMTASPLQKTPLARPTDPRETPNWERWSRFQSKWCQE